MADITTETSWLQTQAPASDNQETSVTVSREVVEKGVSDFVAFLASLPDIGQISFRVSAPDVAPRLLEYFIKRPELSGYKKQAKDFCNYVDSVVQGMPAKGPSPLIIVQIFSTPKPSIPPALIQSFEPITVATFDTSEHMMDRYTIVSQGDEISALDDLIQPARLTVVCQSEIALVNKHTDLRAWNWDSPAGDIYEGDRSRSKEAIANIAVEPESLTEKSAYSIGSSPRIPGDDGVGTNEMMSNGVMLSPDTLAGIRAARGRDTAAADVDAQRYNNPYSDTANEEGETFIAGNEPVTPPARSRNVLAAAALAGGLAAYEGYEHLRERQAGQNEMAAHERETLSEATENQHKAAEQSDHLAEARPAGGGEARPESGEATEDSEAPNTVEDLATEAAEAEAEVTASGAPETAEVMEPQRPASAPVPEAEALEEVADTGVEDSGGGDKLDAADTGVEDLGAGDRTNGPDTGAEDGSAGDRADAADTGVEDAGNGDRLDAADTGVVDAGGGDKIDAPDTGVADAGGGDRVDAANTGVADGGGSGERAPESGKAFELAPESEELTKERTAEPHFSEGRAAESEPSRGGEAPHLEETSESNLPRSNPEAQKTGGDRYEEVSEQSESSGGKPEPSGPGEGEETVAAGGTENEYAQAGEGQSAPIHEGPTRYDDLRKETPHVAEAAAETGATAYAMHHGAAHTSAPHQASADQHTTDAQQARYTSHADSLGAKPNGSTQGTSPAGNEDRPRGSSQNAGTPPSQRPHFSEASDDPGSKNDAHQQRGSNDQFTHHESSHMDNKGSERVSPTSSDFNVKAEQDSSKPFTPPAAYRQSWAERGGTLGYIAGLFGVGGAAPQNNQSPTNKRRPRGDDVASAKDKAEMQEKMAKAKADVRNGKSGEKINLNDQTPAPDAPAPETPEPS